MLRYDWRRMLPNRRPHPSRAGFLCSLALLGACSSLTTLTVRKTTPDPLTLVPGPQLAERTYKRILLLPPEHGVSVEERIESQVPKDKDTAYYTAKLEKVLLSKGFEVVASEIVARAKTHTAKGAHSFAERALIMGRETQADAVLSIQELRVTSGERFFHRLDLKDVAPAERTQDDDGRYFHRETEECLYRLPLYQVYVSAKLIDVQDGDVLWVGEGTERTLDALPKSWVAQLDEDCQVTEQVPYNYRDYLAGEPAFDTTVNGLLMRLIEPLRVRALAPRAPKPVIKPVVEAPAPTPAPEPPPVAAPKPVSTVKTATITGGRAILRELPQSDGIRISLVDRQSKVEVLSSSGGWHKIKLADGTVGWMLDDSLTLDR